MKFLFLLSVFCVLVAAAISASSIGFYKDPKYPDKCVKDGLILSPGEEAQLNYTCGRMICGGEGLIEFHTCGVEGVPDGYKLGEPINPKSPYPDCCEREHVKV